MRAIQHERAIQAHLLAELQGRRLLCLENRDRYIILLVNKIGAHIFIARFERASEIESVVFERVPVPADNLNIENGFALPEEGYAHSHRKYRCRGGAL